MPLRGQTAFCDITPGDEKRLRNAGQKKFVRLNVLHQRTIDTLAAAIDGARIPYGAIRTKWTEQRSGPFKGFEFCTCVALQGSVMHKTSCSIYASRPNVCREAVKPGDRMCRELRRIFKAKIADLC
jgi:Fe-S-cluster containining protein